MSVVTKQSDVSVWRFELRPGWLASWEGVGVMSGECCSGVDCVWSWVTLMTRSSYIRDEHDLSGATSSCDPYLVVHRDSPNLTQS